MKKILLIGAITLSSLSFSQTFNWVAGTTMTEDLQNNTTVQLKIEQEAANPNDSVVLGIRVVEKSIPDNWDGMLCVQGLCYGTIRPVGFEGEMIKIGGDTRGYVRLTVNPMDNNQFARYGIYVFDVNFPNDGDTAVWILNPTLGVNEIVGKTEVGVYPNPTKGIVQIETATPINSIQVINLNGQVVLNSSNESFTNKALDLSHLPAGMYQLLLTKNNGEIVQEKITIE